MSFSALKTCAKGEIHDISAIKCSESQFAIDYQVSVVISVKLSSILDKSQLSSSIRLEITTNE